MSGYIERNRIHTDDPYRKNMRLQLDLGDAQAALSRKIDALISGDLPAWREKHTMSYTDKAHIRAVTRNQELITAKATLRKGIKPDSKTTIKRWRHEERELAKPINWHNEE